MQVSSSGLLETKIREKGGSHVRVGGRMYDHTNSVRFAIHTFDGGVFDMPEPFHPDNNDWTITGKGIVMIRFTWKKFEWTQEAEQACLSLSDRVTAWLRACC